MWCINGDAMSAFALDFVSAVSNEPSIIMFWWSWWDDNAFATIYCDVMGISMTFKWLTMNECNRDKCCGFLLSFCCVRLVRCRVIQCECCSGHQCSRCTDEDFTDRHFSSMDFRLLVISSLVFFFHTFRNVEYSPQKRPYVCNSHHSG